MKTNCIIHGDCLPIMQKMPAESVDLFITSPPYANARKKTYGGHAPEDYGDWFMPRSEEMFRVLKPSGSFVLNIKECAVNGERSTYVLGLILGLRDQGWYWTEEYLWHKTCCAPGKWPNRFRDAWERCLHFTKGRDFTMNQNAVRVYIAKSTKDRAKYTSGKDLDRTVAATGSNFGTSRVRWANKDIVYPDNVLVGPTEFRNKGHPAVFPLWLPTWFIKLFSNSGDVVLDPFCGSSTSCVAAALLGRKYIGVDSNMEYVKLGRKRIKDAKISKTISQ